MRTLFILFCLLLPALPLCAAPDWLNGVSNQYPARDYLIGVGLGDSLDSARASARAEIATVFTARITQRARDSQQERSTRDHRRTRIQSEHTIQQSTTVSTDELLKGVLIAETWHDPKKNQHYALAVLDRRAAAQVLARQIREQNALLAGSRMSIETGTGIIPQLRAVCAALASIDTMEDLTARLQVIDPTTVNDSGDARVRADLEHRRAVLSAQVHCMIEADDTPGLQSRLAEKITAFGCTTSSSPADAGSLGAVTLILRAAITVTPVQRNNPRWKFSNWESMVTLIEPAANKAVVAAVVKNGQSAQVTEEAARIKAVADAVNAAADAAARAVHTYIYGQ